MLKTGFFSRAFSDAVTKVLRSVATKEGGAQSEGQFGWPIADTGTVRCERRAYRRWILSGRSVRLVGYTVVSN